MGLTQTGEGMRHGVLTVQQPTTFLIVLRGGGMPTDYKIEVTKLN